MAQQSDSGNLPQQGFPQPPQFPTPVANQSGYANYVQPSNTVNQPPQGFPLPPQIAPGFNQSGIGQVQQSTAGSQPSQGFPVPPAQSQASPAGLPSPPFGSSYDQQASTGNLPQQFPVPLPQFPPGTTNNAAFPAPPPQFPSGAAQSAYGGNYVQQSTTGQPPQGFPPPPQPYPSGSAPSPAVNYDQQSSSGKLPQQGFPAPPFQAPAADSYGQQQAGFPVQGIPPSLQHSVNPHQQPAATQPGFPQENPTVRPLDSWYSPESENPPQKPSLRRLDPFNKRTDKDEET